ncbi:MAG: hypothetical protein L0211_22115 [Planctomycetaceae bacterium]|nr:hypothetical protein [Planctomycetaceae bacterium]
MHFSTSPVIGTIAIEPRRTAGLPLDADDSSLEALFASLVCGPLHARQHERPRFMAGGRLSRFGLFEPSDRDAVRADFTRLLADLEAEYDRLAMA